MAASAGLALPATIGDFHRTSGSSGDAVTYVGGRPGHEITAAVHVLPAPPVDARLSQQAQQDLRAQLCDGLFHGEGRRLTTAHPGSELAHETLETTGLGPGRKAVYDMTNVPWFGHRQSIRTELHTLCFVRGAWTIQIRVDYLYADSPTAAVAALLSGLTAGRQ